MVATLQKNCEISRMCCKHLQTCRKYSQIVCKHSYMLYVETHSTLGKSICMYTYLYCLKQFVNGACCNTVGEAGRLPPFANHA